MLVKFALSTPSPVLPLVAGFWLLAQHLPVQACNPADVLQMHVQVDARDSGYRVSEADGSALFRLAAYDLVQGRIGFFEVETSSGHFIRHSLSDSHSAACIARHQVAGLPIPAEKCISAVQAPAPASRFRIESNGSTTGHAPTAVSVREQQTGKLLARYQLPDKIQTWFAGLFGDNACYAAASPTKPALWMITGFVFPDRWGNTLTLTDLDRVRAEQEAGLITTELLPPLPWVRRRLAEEGRLDRNECSLPGWMGATEVHVLELARGPLEIEARLDAESNKAGVVLVDVHAPDKAVVILARAQGPTVWHIHESSSSSIVAVLVRGHHGQAVVGLTAFTRILMSTQLHNPYTHCTARELDEIEARVTQQYGITRTQRQDPKQVPPVVRYGIGEPMRDGAELFHHYRSMEDFEVREVP